MKNPLLALALALLVAPLAWSALQVGAGQEPAAAHPRARWEYRVVGLTEIHGRALDYLGEALEGGAQDEGFYEGLLGLAKRADDKLAQKNEDLLNELGREGWELIDYDLRHMILKRPAR